MSRNKPCQHTYLHTPGQLLNVVGATARLSVLESYIKSLHAAVGQSDEYLI